MAETAPAGASRPLWRQIESGRVVHRFEPIVLALALLSVPVLLLEETSDREPWTTIATVGNWVIWVGFAAELAFVLVVAPRKLRALRAHWLDVAIVVLTPPFLPALLGALRLLRLVRFLRIIRVARLGLLGGRALMAARVLTTRQGFRYVALSTVLLVVVAGFAVSVADSEKFPNVWLGMWWAITTVTTVGYGDVTPTTVAGRVLAACLMLIGIGFLSLLTATIASTFVSSDTGEGEQRIEDEQERLAGMLRRIEERLERIETALDR